MTYKEREKKEQLMREVKRSVYTQMIDGLIRGKSYDDMHSMERIELITVVNKHGRLLNRYES